jgi:hypothetical protein
LIKTEKHRGNVVDLDVQACFARIEDRSEGEALGTAAHKWREKEHCKRWGNDIKRERYLIFGEGE